MASFNRRNGLWHVRVRIKNCPTQCASFVKRRQAEAWARKTEGDALAGKITARLEAGFQTIGDLLSRYCETVTPQKRGARQERNVIGLIRSEARTLCALRVEATRPTDVSKVRDMWLAAGIAPATVRNRLAVISAAFNHARREWGIESENPCARVRKPFVANERRRRLMDRELDRIIGATNSHDLPTLITLLTETALRRSEALGLEWRRVFLEERYVALGREKNGSTGQRVPLSPTAVSLLGAMTRRGDGRVFGLRPDSATQAFARAVQRARQHYEDECQTLGTTVDPDYCRDLRLHDLRREAASRAIESGFFNVIEVAAITRHRNLSVLNRHYATMRTSHLADRLAQAEEARAVISRAAETQKRDARVGISVVSEKDVVTSESSMCKP